MESRQGQSSGFIAAPSSTYLTENLQSFIARAQAILDGRQDKDYIMEFLGDLKSWQGPLAELGTKLTHLEDYAGKEVWTQLPHEEEKDFCAAQTEYLQFLSNQIIAYASGLKTRSQQISQYETNEMKPKTSEPLEFVKDELKTLMNQYGKERMSGRPRLQSPPPVRYIMNGGFPVFWLGLYRMSMDELYGVLKTFVNCLNVVYGTIIDRMIVLMGGPSKEDSAK